MVVNITGFRNVNCHCSALVWLKLKTKCQVCVVLMTLNANVCLWGVVMCQHTTRLPVLSDKVWPLLLFWLAFVLSRPLLWLCIWKLCKDDVDISRLLWKTDFFDLNFSNRKIVYVQVNKLNIHAFKKNIKGKFCKKSTVSVLEKLHQKTSNNPEMSLPDEIANFYDLLSEVGVMSFVITSFKLTNLWNSAAPCKTGAT